MSGARDRVRMDDAGLAELWEANLKVQVATIGPDGAPHLSTLFYVLREGDLAFWTYARSQKVRNLERDPRVTALVEDGVEYGELRGASVRGRAEILRDPDEVLEVGLAVAVRMSGLASADDLGEAGRDLVRAQAAKRVVVVVRPEHVASWDHRRLG